MEQLNLGTLSQWDKRFSNMVEEIRDSVMGDPIGKILMVVAVGLLTWNIKTTQDLTIDVAVVKEKMTTATTDRYTSKQAESDFALVDQKISTLEERIDSLEQLNNVSP